MRYRGTFVALGAALLLASACSDSNSPGQSHVGVYTLDNVNGDEVPAIVFELDVYRLDVNAGTLTLKPDNTFSSTLDISEYQHGVETDHYPVLCSGSYRRSGNAITLTSPGADDCGGTLTATLSGNTLTVEDPSLGTAEYVKK
jgi:hypothetical protein